MFLYPVLTVPAKNPPSLRQERGRRGRRRGGGEGVDHHPDQHTHRLHGVNMVYDVQSTCKASSVLRAVFWSGRAGRAVSQSVSHAEEGEEDRCWSSRHVGKKKKIPEFDLVSQTWFFCVCSFFSVFGQVQPPVLGILFCTVYGTCFFNIFLFFFVCVLCGG